MNNPKRNGRITFWFGAVMFILLAAGVASLQGYNPFQVIVFAVIFPAMTLGGIAFYIAIVDRLFGKSTNQRIDEYIEVNRREKDDQSNSIRRQYL